MAEEEAAVEAAAEEAAPPQLPLVLAPRLAHALWAAQALWAPLARRAALFALSSPRQR